MNEFKYLKDAQCFRFDIRKQQTSTQCLGDTK